MTQFNKLALAGAIGALMLSANVANAHVSYNITAGPADGSQADANFTAGNMGYAGNLPATWIAEIHNDSGPNSQTASSADAIADGGIAIGMGAKAYKDGTTDWGHSADFGLFDLHHDATVTITVSSDGSDLHPAFGLWEGWDTNSDSSRHQAYLNNGAVNPGAPGPLGSSLGNFLGWAKSDTQGTTASATLSLFLTAGQYTMILGGYDGTTAGGNLAYTATISAVPLPAAVWLFGSALAGMGVIGRRKVRPSA
jgi:hypothetical protein